MCLDNRLEDLGWSFQISRVISTTLMVGTRDRARRALAVGFILREGRSPRPLLGLFYLSVAVLGVPVATMRVGGFSSVAYGVGICVFCWVCK
uniref:Membrane protein n=1 Tax=Magnetospirillum gryphiswaldense TaxID=55518 RepID=A4TTN8_9PROT|nr:membrane protein [Magnetospirillum gryphiswaldense MSR-1]